SLERPLTAAGRETSEPLRERRGARTFMGGRRSQNRGPHASFVELAPPTEHLHRCSGESPGFFFLRPALRGPRGMPQRGQSFTILYLTRYRRAVSSAETHRPQRLAPSAAGRTSAR